MQALFGAMQDFIFVFNTQGQHLKTLPTRAVVPYQTQLDPDDPEHSEFVPLAQTPRFLRAIQKVAATKKSISLSYSLFIQGQETFFEAAISPMSDEAVVWIARDVTERKQAEELLKQSEERFRSYFNLPLVGIAITSPEKGWLDVNAKACEMLGYTREELVQLTWSELTHPEDLVLDIDLFNQILDGEIEQYAMDKRYLCKDGTILYTNIGVGCVRKPDGSVDYTVALIQDITARKLAEAALRESEAALRVRAQEVEETLRSLQLAQTQLIQSEKMSSLGQLVAGVAHEINNPVGFIHGNIAHAKEYAEDLLELLQLYQTVYPTPIPAIQEKAEDIDLEFLKEDFPRLFSSMKMGSERIREIVLSLRNFSRLDEAEMKTVDIHEGIDNTLLILQNRLKLKPNQPGILVVKDYGDLPLIECYPGQLNQVFMNILTNAIDALDEALERSPQVFNADRSPTIHLRTGIINTDWVEIQISDNGPGMTEKVRSRLFDPFFTTKPVGKGTGMGLSISYQIVVEKHSGSLLCHSIPGQGTEFTIRIPIQQQRRECGNPNVNRLQETA